MSLQPFSTASGGRAASLCHEREAACAYIAAGVASVMSEVDTTPVDMPARSASSPTLATMAVFDEAQFPVTTASESERTPIFVLTPVAIDDAVPALSGTCESVL